MTMLKFGLILVNLLIICSCYSQDCTNVNFIIRGQIYDGNQKLKGTTKVMIQRNGRTFEEVRTDSLGRYKGKVGLYGRETFDIVYKHRRRVSKFIRFHIAEFEGGDLNMPTIDMELFRKKRGAQLKFMKTEPVAVFRYDGETEMLRLDAKHSEYMRDKINLELKSE
jgi:hypothetical protein